MDLAIACEGSYTAATLLGDGTGNFALNMYPTPTGREPDSIAAGDFNGDGRLDIALTNHIDDTISVMTQIAKGLLSSTSMNFGDHLVGKPSPPQTVTLTNGGSATLNISGIVLAGPQSRRF